MDVCRATLADDAAVVHADWGAQVATADLLTIYRRRASHVRDIGLPTLGFDETVERLEATPHATLRLASVEPGRGYPRCVISLAPDQPAVVAALAVTGPMPAI